MIKLQRKDNAVLYQFETEDGETLYRIMCVDGEVCMIDTCKVEYFDDGDAENGPSLGSNWTDYRELFCSQDWFEKDLEKNIEAIIKDAEAYTAHCSAMSENNGSMDGHVMACPICGHDSIVIKVNPANMLHVDPTETYTLKCGHTII